MSASATSSGAQTGPARAGWFRAYGVGVVDLPHNPDATAQATEPEQRGGVVYLGQLPDGPTTVLAGPSAVLYRALVKPVVADSARVVAVARGLGVAPQEVDPEAITDFAAELVAAGLLSRSD